MRRKAEGPKHLDLMRRVADKVRELFGQDEDRRVSTVLASIAKSGKKFSCWDLVKHFQERPDDLELYELDRTYSRSWYRLRVSEMDPDILQHLISWMAKRMPARHSW